MDGRLADASERVERLMIALLIEGTAADGEIVKTEPTKSQL